jgi:quercetin dioxygenase-like cupin family protein
MQKLNKMRDYINDQLEDRALLIQAEEGERLSLEGMAITFKLSSEQSNDQLGVYEIELAPKTIGAKLHYHRFMDETFIVKEGIIKLQMGSENYEAKAGTIAYVPRFTPHGFRNDSDQVAKLLLLFNPAQKREGFFRGLHEILGEDPVNKEKFIRLYNKYDSFPLDEEDMIQLDK